MTPDWDALAASVLDRCRQLAAHTEVPGTITRTFLTPPMRPVHALLDSWAGESGLDTWLDAAGNWHARRPGAGPAVLVGSHLDTVPNGGAYDGPLGVLLGLALAEALPDVPLHVVGFSEEEGVRFGVPFFGSRALLGTAGELLSQRGADGRTVADYMQEFGLDSSRLPGARLTEPPRAYLEFHIEQGPVLEAAGRPLGPVSAVAGQSRLDLVLRGEARHAGTTPMDRRRDALAGAAELVLAAEALAGRTGGLVATVGMLEVRPGAGNVVPGEARLSLDVRHAEDPSRERTVEQLLAEARTIADRRGLDLAVTPRLSQPAVPMDPRLRALLAGALRAEGLEAGELVSGAGHDAMVLAQICPSAMLFLRSPGGISHHPDEAVVPADVAAALRVGARFLTALVDADV